MKPFSPVDAIGPAFRRVREVMATPFHLGFFLKIALVAALTQPGFYSVLISYPIQGMEFAAGSAARHANAAVPPVANFDGGIGAMAGGITLLVLAVLCVVGIALWILSTYLFCRLRFTLFDLVVYKQGRVRQAWSKYGPQSWRYFGVMILASFVFMILFAVTAGPFFIGILRTFKGIAAQGPNPNPNPLPVLAAMLPLIGICLLLALIWMVVDAVLQDFVLPPMAIENASIEGAFGRFFALLRNDAGSVLLYLLLRFVIALGISWVLMFAVFLAVLVVGAGGAGVGFGLYHAMWQGGLGLRITFIAIAAALALVVLAVYLIAVTAVYGITAVFKQSYAIYFFGGRYPELGSRLEPPSNATSAGMGVETVLPPMPPLQEPPLVW